jgi:hypothetical protein
VHGSELLATVLVERGPKCSKSSMHEALKHHYILVFCSQISLFSLTANDLCVGFMLLSDTAVSTCRQLSCSSSTFEGSKTYKCN